jgi:16S rRNA (guanine527-N7)-methyltransferase
MTPQAALEQGLDALALKLPAEACAKLLDYLALMRKWNRTYNLTAIRDPLGMVTHHLLDSLATVPHLGAADAALRVADIGSGAGLPGIPLAVARPAWHVTLNDRSGKKAAFLRQAQIELALPNVEVHEGDVAQWQPHQRFDCVITRAFAVLEDFVTRCRHLLAPGGVLAAMKGARPDAAPPAALPGDVRCTDVRRLRVPLLDAERHLVLCRIDQAIA